MIVRDAKGTEIKLDFRYSKRGKLITTRCDLKYPDFTDPYRVEINKAFADQHNKAIARKEALTKLLKKMKTSSKQFGKEDRKAIWESYLSQVRH